MKCNVCAIITSKVRCWANCKAPYIYKELYTEMQGMGAGGVITSRMKGRGHQRNWLWVQTPGHSPSAGQPQRAAGRIFPCKRARQSMKKVKDSAKPQQQLSSGLIQVHIQLCLRLVSFTTVTSGLNGQRLELERAPADLALTRALRSTHSSWEMLALRLTGEV